MTIEKERHVLVVFPHPDDEAFSSAGLIRLYRNMDVPVTYACLTLGEMGRNLGNPPFATRESLPEIRRKELKEACRAMGIEDLRMMGLRDKTVEFEDPEKLINMVKELIDEVNPSLIITFLPGYAVHPDHEATARAVVEAVFRMPKEERPRILTVGFANNTVEEMGEPDVKIDISSVKDDKVAALRAHNSQTAWMIQESTKRVEEGKPMSESWLQFEQFYTYRFND